MRAPVGVERFDGVHGGELRGAVRGGCAAAEAGLPEDEEVVENDHIPARLFYHSSFRTSLNGRPFPSAISALAMAMHSSSSGVREGSSSSISSSSR